METFDVVLGALIAASGWLAARALPRKRKAYKDPPAICGCNHHFSYHDPDGRCHRIVDSLAHSGQCTCRRYTGPVPIETLIP